jgi:hypothetical protein
MWARAEWRLLNSYRRAINPPTFPQEATRVGLSKCNSGSGLFNQKWRSLTEDMAGLIDAIGMPVGSS